MTFPPLVQVWPQQTCHTVDQILCSSQSHTIKKPPHFLIFTNSIFFLKGDLRIIHGVNWGEIHVLCIATALWKQDKGLVNRSKPMAIQWDCLVWRLWTSWKQIIFIFCSDQVCLSEVNSLEVPQLCSDSFSWILSEMVTDCYVWHNASLQVRCHTYTCTFDWFWGDEHTESNLRYHIYTFSQWIITIPSCKALAKLMLY